MTSFTRKCAGYLRHRHRYCDVTKSYNSTPNNQHLLNTIWLIIGKNMQSPTWNKHFNKISIAMATETKSLQIFFIQQTLSNIKRVCGYYHNMKKVLDYRIDHFANPNFCWINSFVGAICNVFAELMSQNLTE